LEKVGLFWKMPGFFFKRLKLDQLGKSRAFSKKALLFPENARLFRLKLRTLENNGILLLHPVWCRSGTETYCCYTLYGVAAREIQD
jgi:hypothetical protein